MSNDTITPADVAAIAKELHSLRVSARDADGLTGGDYLVVAMSPSGKVKYEAVTSWHVKRDPSNLWGIAYKVANPASTYQANGVVCGFERSYEDAQATIAKLKEAGTNGRQTIVPNSLTVVPAYIVKRDEFAAVTAVLKAAYEAWIAAPVATPAKRARKPRKAS